MTSSVCLKMRKIMCSTSGRFFSGCWRTSYLSKWRRGFIMSPGNIRMDPAKVSAATNWPVPSDRKQFFSQQFLGFAYFYRRFIRNYSSVVAPLHVPSPLQAPGLAQEAFRTLKHHFTSAPVLTLLDPKLWVIVEVDASDVGVGAILSQCSPKDNRVHPAFFSRKLSPTERNHSVGNRELLALKLALEEWKHWLRGPSNHFWHGLTIKTLNTSKLPKG